MPPYTLSLDFCRYGRNSVRRWACPVFLSAFMSPPFLRWFQPNANRKCRLKETSSGCFLLSKLGSLNYYFFFAPENSSSWHVCFISSWKMDVGCYDGRNFIHLINLSFHGWDSSSFRQSFVPSTSWQYCFSDNSYPYIRVYVSQNISILIGTALPNYVFLVPAACSARKVWTVDILWRDSATNLRGNRTRHGDCQGRTCLQVPHSRRRLLVVHRIKSAAITDLVRFSSFPLLMRCCA